LGLVLFEASFCAGGLARDEGGGESPLSEKGKTL